MIQAAASSKRSPTLKRRLLELVYTHGFNRVILKLAGRRWSPWAGLRHVGRRSGRPYITPVLAFAVADGVLIPLPFGPDTDWCRNLLAANRFTLRWQGRELDMAAPHVVENPGPWRVILRRYLKAQRAA